MTALTAEGLHLQAVLKAFRDLGAEQVYEREALPRVLPPAYSEIEITRRVGGNARGSGEIDTMGLYEITERSTSRFAATLRDHRDAVAAIENVTLEIDGHTSTPVMFAGADPITPDDGWYVGFRTWTYVL
jgi:hypothetical protein